MLVSVDLRKLRNLLVHEVFPRDIEGARKVVDLLVSLQLLVDDALAAADVPDDAWLCEEVSLILCGQLTETVVLERVPNDLDVAVAHVKVIPVVWRKLGPHLDRILVYPEDEKPLPNL